MSSGKFSPSVSWEISSTQSEGSPEEDKMAPFEYSNHTDDGVPKLARMAGPYASSHATILPDSSRGRQNGYIWRCRAQRSEGCEDVRAVWFASSHPAILSLGLIQAVYFRVYTEDGAIPSKSLVYSDDPYLARIWAKQVALPHTVMSLKRYLSAVEHIGNYNDTSLFQSVKSDISMADTSHVSLTSGSGPGSTPDNPTQLFAKAITERPAPFRPAVALLPPREGQCTTESTLNGAIISKQPTYGSEDLSLGGIDIDTITPPHTITSVKLHKAKAEQLDNVRNAKFFTGDMSSQSLMDARG
jgi:hypothetical protein